MRRVAKHLPILVSLPFLVTASIGLLKQAALADAVPLATEEQPHRYAASGAESKCLSADKWFLLDLLPEFVSAQAAANWRARALCNLSGATLEAGCANLGNQWRLFGEEPEAQDATCEHGALGTVHFTVLGLRPFPKCPSGYVASGEECVPAGANDAKNNGEPKDCTGNPCNPATGNKYQAEEDYRSGDGTLSFVRHYNSHESLIKNNRARRNVNLGVNWHANIDRAISLTEGETLTSATITRPDGKIYYHSFIGGVWQADSDVDPQLEQTASGSTYSLPDSARETYDAAGRLVSETDRSGKTTTYGYDASGHLETVTGPFGHVLTLAYDPEGRLNTLTDPAGAISVYDYDLNGNLSQVTYPDGTTRIYHYEKTSFPHHLTGITDENGDRFAIFDYSPLGNAILTEHAGGQERFNLRYDSNTRTTVTDAIGTVEVLTFAVNLGVKNLSSRINQTDGKGITQQFDENNNLIRRTDEEGRTTTFTYNAHNQRLSMTEGVGTPEERTTTFSYVSDDIDLPTEVITPSVAPGQQKRLTTVYDANNNPIRITESGFTPSGDAVSRTITMAYNAFGQVITIDGPRTDLVDITTLEYYECASGAECGQLKRITNAAGHMTTYDAYDAHGRVTRLTDPNGVVTAFTYDPRGRVTSITLTPPAGPARTTTNTYDGVGQLRRVTTPDGTTLTYAYDAAHDLRSITDNLGNRIEYDYDARGNRIAERIFDPDATLVRTIENQYDRRNRLEQINAAGSITQLLNDAVGNLIQQTDPNANPSTRHSYDALNRLFRTIDALSGITSYGYDVNDRLTQVTAPNNATTQYVYDDLGNPLREDSPDRGTRIHTYDAAGNLKTLTDPRGVTALYTYDALNRLTFIDYPNATEDVTFTYDVQGCTSAAGAGCAGAADTCPHGIGRLCAVQDESGTTRFSYDPYGNVIEQIHTELGISFTTAYTFDAADRVVSMTYPDGRLVRYTRDAIGRITKVTTTVNDDTTTLLDNVTYRADGLTTAQTFGNGLAETRLYDRQGRLISQFVGGADTRAYDYDANGNVIRKQTLPEVASYNYDALDRLDAETATNGSVESVDYSYDPNGNRLGANEDTYSYVPLSNRLAAIDTDTVTLDPAGNTLSDAQGRSFSYNAAGRLAQLTQSGTTVAIYTYNFQGQRTRKVTAAGTTLYHYDLTGNLTAETDTDGQTINQYVWANGAPVAAYLGGSAAGVFTFNGIDSDNGYTVTVRLDTDAQTLAVDEQGGFNGEVQPDRWVLDEATQTLSVRHRTPAGTRLAASFALAASPPSGRLAIATTPRRASYRFPKQSGETLTGTDTTTGESATLSLDPTARTVTLAEHGTTRILPIAPEDWTSIGFGPSRLTIFRFEGPEFVLFGLVLERQGSAQGFLSLRDGIARQTSYDLTGQAGRTAQLVYVHTDHLNTPRLATDDTQTVRWRWEGLAFGNTAPKQDPDGDGIETTFNLRFPGQYHDGESGLYYNWNRYYDPRTGRYITSDPIGLDPSFNTYFYAEANPARFIDPSGLLFGIPGFLEKGGIGIAGALPIPGLLGIGFGGGIDILSARSCCADDGKKYVEIFIGASFGVSAGAAGRVSGGRTAFINALTLGDASLPRCLTGFLFKGPRDPSLSGNISHFTFNFERGRKGKRLDLGGSPAVGAAVTLNLFGGEFVVRRHGPIGDCCGN